MRQDGLVHPADASKPTLRSDCFDYLEMYRLLGVGRIWGQGGPLPIQGAEIGWILNEMGVTLQDDRLKCIRLVRKMDLAELEVLNKRLKK